MVTDPLALTFFGIAILAVVGDFARGALRRRRSPIRPDSDQRSAEHVG